MSRTIVAWVPDWPIIAAVRMPDWSSWNWLSAMAKAMSRIMSPIGTFRRSCPIDICLLPFQDHGLAGLGEAGVAARSTSMKRSGGGSETSLAATDDAPSAETENFRS